MLGRKVYLILSFIFIGIIAIALSFYLYNKPHVNIQKTDADYHLSAQQLIRDYEDFEIESNKKYSERLIEVEGQIHEVSTLRGNMVIALKPANSPSSVICHMLPEESEKVLMLKKGQIIKIKGKCTGYLLDVIMVRCILVQ
ncbi:hypothetical protein KCTC52924_01391 [Arenibacter antarcticus]|uniref:OB-fold putative lipoprotein n=1 Tax=Arenibacter antarcticus TaxID=2040469 RepID=A0ABW5VDT6_9FLAO|nr:OB-fold putative lipoprotein [Arenibacter sp. H213]MCM4167804.1 hypothetical protein [Arenibacter sp. H213]